MRQIVLTDDVNRPRGTAAEPPRPRPADPWSAVAATAYPLAPPGFGPLTRIETAFGPCPAQALRVRDRVRLRSGVFCPIARVDRLLLDEAFLDRNHEAQSVLVQPGRLGFGLPTEPILLAPGQKLSDRQRLPASLSTAQDLLRAGMAQYRPERFLTYIIFSFAEAQDICSGGLWLRVEPPDAASFRDDGEEYQE